MKDRLAGGGLSDDGEMNTPNPFKPPEALVADIREASEFAGGARVGLAVATALQLAMFCLWSARHYLLLVDIGALTPIGLASLIAGLACLYIGVARLVVTRRFGARLLLASVILQLATALLWHAFFLSPWSPSGAVMMLAPLLLGFGLAVWGWLAARPHARAAVAMARRQGMAP